MQITTRLIIFVAMTIFTIVSMWTTYASLHDSILPGPTIPIPISAGKVWDCSIFALGLSVAIGLMLFALKLAIIDEQKRLNPIGLLGLVFVGFISISFNIDVLYRWADQDFFIRYSNDRMRSVYEDYLARVQLALTEKQGAIQREVAVQEGELESEIKGLREAPSGYGTRARQEDYHLTVLRKTSEVDLKPVEDALAAAKKVDQLLLTASTPVKIQDVMDLQDQLRVVIKDAGVVSGLPLPDPVKLDSPFFAVFDKLFTWKDVGFKEIFIVLTGFLLDLGDIIGYSMIPNAKRRTFRPALQAIPEMLGPEVIPPRSLELSENDLPMPLVEETPEQSAVAISSTPKNLGTAHHAHRPFRFRRR